MYYKIIGERTVFSTCKTIELDGRWISNPSAEQIAEAGWLPYVPPVVPPQPEIEPDYGDVLAAIKKMLSSETDELSDEDALKVAAAFPTWEEKVNEGKEVATGKRLWFDGRLWKVLQPHIPQSNWTPDTAVSLYVEVTIEEWPEIPENIPAADPWMNGWKGTWKGEHYICQMDNCVWNPDQYLDAWEKVG